MDFKDILYYDETSPTFLRWTKDKWIGKYKNVKKYSVGDVAGCFQKDKNGNDEYAIVTINRKAYKAHRIIWQLLKTDLPDDAYIDHLDGNGCNNRIDNLEVKTSSGNSRNKKKSTRNSSGVVGVVLNRNGNHLSYHACWYDLDGLYKRKSFSLKKYGVDEAFALAVKYRNDKISEMNVQGAGYTDRHGQ